MTRNAQKDEAFSYPQQKQRSSHEIVVLVLITVTIMVDSGKVQHIANDIRNLPSMKNMGQMKLKLTDGTLEEAKQKETAVVELAHYCLFLKSVITLQNYDWMSCHA